LLFKVIFPSNALALFPSNALALFPSNVLELESKASALAFFRLQNDYGKNATFICTEAQSDMMEFKVLIASLMVTPKAEALDSNIKTYDHTTPKAEALDSNIKTYAIKLILFKS